MEKLREYVSLDLEMTGLNTTSDQIIEIGAVIVKGDEVEQLQSFFGRIIPSQIRLQRLPESRMRC